MKPDARIPIVIGVSGRRQLRAGDLSALEAAVTAQLQLLQRDYPHSPLVMLNSLAAGADQLAARAALALCIPYIAILPMEAAEYRRDFSGEALTEFDALLAKATRTIVVPQIETPPANPDRDCFYRQAGVYVAMHSHVLLALWDGTPPVQGGCGTAEVVDMVLNGHYAPARGNILRSEDDGAVLHILAPRSDTPGIAGQTAFLGHPDAYQGILKKIDAFNRRAAAFSGRTQALPGAAMGDETTARLDAVYQKADGLSGRAAKDYRRILALLAVAGVIVTLGFLMYDELEMYWVLLICGLMLLLAGGAYRYAGKSDAHGRYLEYRALAEALRVQAYLRLSGTDVSAASLMTWTQRTETLWIKEAIAALTIAPPSNGHSDIRDCWIREQRNYHRRAGERARAAKKERADHAHGAAPVRGRLLHSAAVRAPLRRHTAARASERPPNRPAVSHRDQAHRRRALGLHALCRQLLRQALPKA